MKKRRNRTISDTFVRHAVAGAVAVAVSVMEASGISAHPFLGTTWQDTAYPSFGDFFTQLTPENDGKWGSVEPVQGTFDWSHLSAMYTLAAQRGMLVKQHNMIWKGQQPAWVTAGNATSAEQAWFSAYAGKFSPNVMDVVNEPLDGAPQYASGLPDGGTSSSSYGGFGWVVQAYKLARTDFPNATLLINDYGILASGTKTAQYMALIKTLKSKGLIDGIGLEAHGLEHVSTQTIQTDLNTLDTLGLPIYISEYDLNQSNDAAQLAQMKAQFPIFYTNSMVKGVTLWDFAYGHTWQSNANLLYANGNPRPAMQWLERYVNPGGTVIDSGAVQTVASAAGIATGPIAIDFGGGTLRYAEAGINLKNVLQINDNAAFIDINGQTGAQYSGNISGGGSLTIENTANSGNDSLLLAGTDSVSGVTTIAGNTRLVLDAITGVSGTGVITGAVTVNADGSLSGNGTVANTLLLAGTLAPGERTAGTITVQNLIINNGGKLDFILNTANAAAGTAGNSLVAAADVTLGSHVVVSITAGPSFGAGMYHLLSFSGGIANAGDINSWIINGPVGFSYALTDPAGMINLSVTAVPEPATLALLLLGISAIALCRRRAAGSDCCK